jgi:hypothetical protein
MDDGRLYCRDEVRVMMRAILKLKGPQASSQIFKGIATPFFIQRKDLFNLLLTLT